MGMVSNPMAGDDRGRVVPVVPVATCHLPAFLCIYRIVIVDGYMTTWLTTGDRRA